MSRSAEERGPCMRIELAACEVTLLAEIANFSMTRDDVATTYALSIASSERDRVDWGKVNAAILDRWSPHALRYIKGRAWRQLEKMHGGNS